MIIAGAGIRTPSAETHHKEVDNDKMDDNWWQIERKVQVITIEHSR